MSQPPVVQFIRLNRGYHGARCWQPAFVAAVADGYLVRCRGRGRGWHCECADPDCQHIAAVTPLVHPDTLAELELKDDHHLRRERYDAKARQ